MCSFDNTAHKGIICAHGHILHRWIRVDFWFGGEGENVERKGKILWKHDMYKDDEMMLSLNYLFVRQMRVKRLLTFAKLADPRQTYLLSFVICYLLFGFCY